MTQLVFPLSGTGQYSTVRFGTAHPDPACVSTERYGSVRFGTAHPDPACVSTEWYGTGQYSTIRDGTP